MQWLNPNDDSDNADGMSELMCAACSGSGARERLRHLPPPTCPFTHRASHTVLHTTQRASWLMTSLARSRPSCATFRRYIKKYTVKSHVPVSNPKFEVITPGSEWGVASRAQKIKNGQIRKAIKRDENIWNA